MKTDNLQTKETASPMLWYWSQPEEGNDLEECEKIVNAYRFENFGQKYFDLPIMFV